jgi:hypothetical protein
VATIASSGHVVSSGADPWIEDTLTVAAGQRIVALAFADAGTGGMSLSWAGASTPCLRVRNLNGWNHRLEVWVVNVPSVGTAALRLTPPSSAKCSFFWAVLDNAPILTGHIAVNFHQPGLLGTSTSPQGQINGFGGKTLGIGVMVTDVTSQTISAPSGAPPSASTTSLFEDTGVGTNDHHMAACVGTVPEVGDAGWTFGWTLGTADGWSVITVAIGTGAGDTTTSCLPVMSNVTPFSASATTGPVSWSHTAEAGKTVYAVVQCTSNGSDFTATYGGVPMVLQGFGRPLASGFRPSMVFSLTNPTPGAANIVVTMASGSSANWGGKSFNIAHGPLDGGISMFAVRYVDSVTSLTLPCAGWDEDALMVGVCFGNATSVTASTGTQQGASAVSCLSTQPAADAAFDFTFTASSTSLAIVTFMIPSACRSYGGGAYQPMWNRLASTVSTAVPNPAFYGSVLSDSAWTPVSTGRPGLLGATFLLPGTVRSLLFSTRLAIPAGSYAVANLYRDGGGGQPVLIDGTTITLTGPVAADTDLTLTDLDIQVHRYQRTLWHVELFNGEGVSLDFDLRCSALFEVGGEFPNETIHSGGSGDFHLGALGGTGDVLRPLFNNHVNQWSSGSFINISRLGVAGSVEELFIEEQQPLDDPTDFAALVQLNGVNQDGAGATVDTVFAVPELAYVGGYGGGRARGKFSLPCAVGDELSAVHRTINTGGQGLRANPVVRFKATASGEFPICTGEGGAFASSRYMPPVNNFDGDTAANEARVAMRMPPLVAGPMTIRGNTVRVSVAPGGGGSLNVRDRKNLAAASGAATSSISGASLTALATGGTSSYAGLDDITVELERVGAPTSPGSRLIGLQGHIDPPGESSPPNLNPQYVTQLLLISGYDEDAEDDAPDPGDACDGGGTVPSGTNPSVSSMDGMVAPEFKIEIDVGGGSPTTLRLAKGRIPDDDGYCEPLVLAVGEIERAASDAMGGVEAATQVVRVGDTAGTFKAYMEEDALQDRPARTYVRDGATGGAWILRFQGTITEFEPETDHSFTLTIQDRLTAMANSPFSDQRLLPQTLMDGTNVTDQTPTQSLHGKPFKLLYGGMSDESLGASAQGLVPLDYAAQTSAFYPTLPANLDLYIAGLGYVTNIHRVFGAPNVESETEPTTKEAIPDSAWGVWAWAPFKPGWPYADNWIELGGKRYTGVLLDQSTVTTRLAREGRVPLSMNLCGYPGANGQMIDALEDQWAHFHINFVYGNYDGTGAFASSVPTVNGYSVIDMASVAACKAATAAMLPGGLKGAFIIAYDLEQRTYFEINAQFMTSLGAGAVSFTNAFGQLGLARLDRTNASSGATSRTDLEHHVKGSFKPMPQARKRIGLTQYVFGRAYVKALNALTPTEASRMPYDEFNGAFTSGRQTIGSGTKSSRMLVFEMLRDPDMAEWVAQQHHDWWSIARQECEWRERLSGEDLEIGSVAKVTNYKGGAAWADRRVMILRSRLHGDAPVTDLMRAISVEDLLP